MEASGGGLEGIFLVLRNRGDSQLDIVVPVGIYFRNRGTNQDMITVAESTVSLGPREAARLSVRAACATAQRSTPTPTDRFDIADAPAGAKSFDRLSLTGLSQASIQVALWVLTDDVTLEFLRTRYAQGFFGIASGPPAASEPDLAGAISALRTAEIDLTKRRICVRETVPAPEAATGFASFDGARALEQSSAGQALKAQSQKTAQKLTTQLDDDLAKLKGLQQRWVADGRPMNDAMREIERLQVEISFLERDLGNQQTNLVAALEKNATQIIEQVLREKRLVWATALGRFCAGNPEAVVDVTDEVVRRLNAIRTTRQ
jgi:Skp family chaperone for outer membrane proteins